MIRKTVSVRTLVPIISALIAVRDPICTWQDMAWHGMAPLVHNGPHWSTGQDTAGPTTRKSSSAVSALIGLSLKEEVISLGGNNNLLFTMYNVPNKYIQSARYEFRTGWQKLASFTASAKNAFNSFVGRAFANSRQKRCFSRITKIATKR